MRTWIVLLLGGLSVALLAGCEPGRGCGHCRHEQIGPRMAEPRMALATVLLFDAQPGPFSASDFAYRSDWPAADAFYTPGEVILFSERFVDLQGRGFHTFDHTYRRFDAQRFGIGYR